MFDKGNDKVITYEELSEMMVIVNQSNKEEEVQEFLELLDRDNSNNLTSYEFNKAMEKKMKENHDKQELELAFKSFDDNLDGYLNQTEFR